MQALPSYQNKNLSWNKRAELAACIDYINRDAAGKVQAQSEIGQMLRQFENKREKDALLRRAQPPKQTYNSQKAQNVLQDYAEVELPQRPQSAVAFASSKHLRSRWVQCEQRRSQLSPQKSEVQARANSPDKP